MSLEALITNEKYSFASGFSCQSTARMQYSIGGMKGVLQNMDWHIMGAGELWGFRMLGPKSNVNTLQIAFDTKNHGIGQTMFSELERRILGSRIVIKVCMEVLLALIAMKRLKTLRYSVCGS